MSESLEFPVPDYQKLMRLDGKGFIVLGAGQGMGRQVSHGLHQAGARVFCVDIDAERARRVAGEVHGIAHVADCTSRESVQELVDTAASKLGAIDGFVDIIGIATWKSILDYEDAAWDRQFDLVLRHAYYIAQIAGRRMRERGGTMVFIASVSGLRAAPFHAPYGAAKAALMALVKSVAVELAPHGVRCNAVAPGAIKTPRILAAASDASERAAQFDQAIPMQRRGLPSEIAAAALFLSCGLSSYITGQTLTVDGGVMQTFPFPAKNT